MQVFKQAPLSGHKYQDRKLIFVHFLKTPNIFMLGVPSLLVSLLTNPKPNKSDNLHNVSKI